MLFSWLLVGSKEVRIFGTGTIGVTGNDGPALSADASPISLDFDQFGNIYVAEGSATRKLTPSGCMNQAFINQTTCDIVCNGLSRLDAHVCSGVGQCSEFLPQNGTSQNETVGCVCKPGTSGINCEVIPCFGKNASSNTCSGRGVCIDVDICECEGDWDGPECEIAPFNCSNIAHKNPLACSEHGFEVKCIAQDTCEHTCNSIGASSASVCSGVGECSSQNNCSCFFGFIGNNCEFLKPCVSNMGCGGECFYLKGVETCVHKCNGVYNFNSSVCSGESILISNIYPKPLFLDMAF